MSGELNTAWAWGMARSAAGWGAVLRQGDAALWVQDINQWHGAHFPLDVGDLIRSGQTRDLQELVEQRGWLADRGVAVESLIMGRPIQSPDRVVGIGLNFRAHARDLKAPVPEEPATFLKPCNTWAASGSPVQLPRASARVTAEAEIALIFGQNAYNLTPQGAARAIWGAMTVLDLTAEDVLQKNPRFLTRAKGYDGFFVMSPWAVAWREEDYRRVRRIETRVDDAIRTQETTDQMIYDFDRVVSFVTDGVHVAPTAVLSTGTPGAAVIHPGTQVAARAEGLYDAYFDTVDF